MIALTRFVESPCRFLVLAQAFRFLHREVLTLGYFGTILVGLQGWVLE